MPKNTGDAYMDLAGEFDQKVREEAERIGVKDWFAAGHAARTVATNNPDLLISLAEAIKAIDAVDYCWKDEWIEKYDGS